MKSIHEYNMRAMKSKGRNLWIHQQLFGSQRNQCQEIKISASRAAGQNHISKTVAKTYNQNLSGAHIVRRR
jgi:hypothetical protein